MKSRRKKRVEVEVEAKLKKDEGEKRVKVKRAAESAARTNGEQTSTLAHRTPAHSA